ncbi:hypothetical protein SmphiM12_359 [Sinorhizobium phage phiM12]|uniref:Uncharacterized protein n=1 Tax=Sinorhizobium phage phiM12 TaxID=1357423 RepID=S5M7G0_9CAUD|nr:hypothetical protein AB690_gp236 [Sinorhizobium phage phiM12]AGR47991.2 hypothetical protein SmphiM12_359 [Sinorhizobium phage phiM12]AKF13178.1 hypothetical protein PHIM19_273 [Sinorhizobium phage phiM19]
MRRTGKNSDQLGMCECCGKHVSEVFLMTEQKSYFSTVRNVESFANTRQLFGHEACLLAVQVTAK